MKIFVKLKGAGNCLRVGNKLVTPHAWEEVTYNDEVRNLLNRGTLQKKEEPAIEPVENENLGDLLTDSEPAENENISPKKRAKK